MKKLSLLFVALTLMISVAAPVLAVAPQEGADSSTINARAEETEWRYRNVNGYIEKRLWSITYSRWLTDWQRV